MKKSLMSNIKNFVDSNVRQRIDRVAHNNNEFYTDDLLLVERHFEDIRQVCIDVEKKISIFLQSIHANNSNSHLGAYAQNVQASLNNMPQSITQQGTNITANSNHVQQSTGIEAIHSGHYRSNESLNNHLGDQTPLPKSLSTSVDQAALDNQISEDIQQKHKKLPIVGFLRFLVKTTLKLKPDSLLAISFVHCTQLQTQLTKLYLSYEATIEGQCLKPIQQLIEVDIPNVVKLRKLFVKSHNDLESFKAKYNGVNQKQQHHAQQQQQQQTLHSSSNSYTVTHSTVQQTQVNKLELLKKEMDEAVMRFEHARDTYEAEIYGFLCRETELVDLIVKFYSLQAEYHQQVNSVIQDSLPTLTGTIATTPRKFAFGTALDEHLRCTGRTISPVLELCVHFLYLQGLKEEGLFRIPGSSTKIKKLKNAINAWFVNLSNLNELESDQTRQSGHSCIIALYDLFKNVVGKPPEASLQLQSAKTDVPSDGGEHIDKSEQGLQSSEIILDTHSIAGLLKLYLRELPEPLLTHSLYDQWIDALNAPSSLSTPAKQTDTASGQQERNKLRCEALMNVVSKLPRSNYENLKYLVKFLKLVTSSQKFNKMTSTNLAIAMSPSIMWSTPSDVRPKGGQSECDNLSANEPPFSMSSFGISASLHAMLLDTLISNADNFFPENVDFTLIGFKELTLSASNHRDLRRNAERPLKSTSPAGISVASSSSFSSNTSNTVNAPAGAVITRTHSRKGGSMEGLMVGSGSDKDTIIDRCLPPSTSPAGDHPTNRPSTIQRGNAFKSTRPASVQIRREDYAAFRQPSLTKAQAPPVPPVPLARSHHIRQPQKLGPIPDGSTELVGSVADTSNNQTPSQRQPAPQVPPPAAPKHHHEDMPNITSEVTPVDGQRVGKPATAPRPVSLRGTGTISPNTPTNQQTQKKINSVRPTVPPPLRPDGDYSIQSDKVGSDDKIILSDRKQVDADISGNDQGDCKPVQIEDDIPVEQDVRLIPGKIDFKSISPIISLNSLTVASDEASVSEASADGDSSFDEVDANSLEVVNHESAECGNIACDEVSNVTRASSSSSADLVDEAKPICELSGILSASIVEKLPGSHSDSASEVITKSVPSVSDNSRDDGEVSRSGIVDSSAKNLLSPDGIVGNSGHDRVPPVRPPRSISPKTARNANSAKQKLQQKRQQQKQFTPM